MNAALWNITVPLDASASSQRGVDYAIELGCDGAILHFCSVVDAAGVMMAGALGAAVDPQPVVEEIESEARRMCDEAISEAHARGVVADGEVVFGSVAAAIARFTRERNCDALVIGTHARTGASRAILGSIAEKLMQTVDVPVIVTHADDELENGSIMVAVDGTAAANSALLVALDLAHAQSRRLAIINVVDRKRASWRADSDILSAAADAARAEDVQCLLIGLEGGAADTIVASARAQHSSMIVMGTSGRSDLARLLLGSVAAKVVERAHVPVTVVRQRSGERSKRKSSRVSRVVST